MNGLYYPEAVVVGKRVTTKQLAKALSDRCTVTLADTLAVLSELGGIMSTYMAQGRSVSLEGLGSFRYTINASKQGVETAEEVSANQVKSVRIRFVPEITRNSDSSVATRSMMPTAVDWIKWGEEEKVTTEEDGTTDSGSAGEEDEGNYPV